MMFVLCEGGCSRPPEIGPDEECYAALDALWTAVTGRREDLLERSAAELQRLHTAGKLPAAALTELEQIVARARGGKWEPAASALREFIRGQPPPERDQ
jgi:hypothetical protein